MTETREWNRCLSKPTDQQKHQWHVYTMLVWCYRPTDEPEQEIRRMREREKRETTGESFLERNYVKDIIHDQILRCCWWHLLLVRRSTTANAMAIYNTNDSILCRPAHELSLSRHLYTEHNCYWHKRRWWFTLQWSYHNDKRCCRWNGFLFLISQPDVVRWYFITKWRKDTFWIASNFRILLILFRSCSERQEIQW